MTSDAQAAIESKAESPYISPESETILDQPPPLGSTAMIPSDHHPAPSPPTAQVQAKRNPSPAAPPALSGQSPSTPELEPPPTDDHSTVVSELHASATNEVLTSESEIGESAPTIQRQAFDPPALQSSEVVASRSISSNPPETQPVDHDRQSISEPATEFADAEFYDQPGIGASQAQSPAKAPDDLIGVGPDSTQLDNLARQTAVEPNISDSRDPVISRHSETELLQQTQGTNPETKAPPTSPLRSPKSITNDLEDLPSATPEPFLQPVPLENALPGISRSPESTQPTGQDSTLPTSEVTQPPLRQNPSQEDRSIRDYLSNVSGQQPSDSSIELIMPRRQRPRPATPPTVQRSGESATASPDNVESRPTTNSPADNTRGSLSASMETADNDNSAPASMIETDIGPLPSDLWDLIGEPIPDAPKPEESASSADQSAPPPTAAVQRAIQAAESRSLSPTPNAALRTSGDRPHETLERVKQDAVLTRSSSASAVKPQDEQTDSPTTIQRTTERASDSSALEARPAGPDSGPLSAPDEADAEGDSEETAEIDVDQLANEVYRVLRQRLAVEKERGRWR